MGMLDSLRNGGGLRQLIRDRVPLPIRQDARNIKSGNLVQKAAGAVGMAGTAASAIPGIGGMVGSHDFGISEAAGQAKVYNPDGSIIKQSPEETSQPVPSAPAPSNPAPSGSTSGGSGSGLSSLASDVEAQKAEEEARAAALKAEQIEGVNKQFDPVFIELDRRLGLLPSQQSEDETRLNNSAELQKTGVADMEKAGNQKLDTAASNEVERTKQGLRDLADNVVSLINAQNQKLGAVGAGDSSATQFGSELVTRQATRERGAAVRQRDNNLSAIDQKRADVAMLAKQEINKIDLWKNDNMDKIVKWYRDEKNNVEGMKANASSEKLGMINDIERGLAVDLINRFRQLDDAVTNYKAGVQTWATTRDSDFASAADAASNYTPSNSPVVQAIQSMFTGDQPTSPDSHLTGLDTNIDKEKTGLAALIQ